MKKTQLLILVLLISGPVLAAVAPAPATPAPTQIEQLAGEIIIINNTFDAINKPQPETSKQKVLDDEATTFLQGWGSENPDWNPTHPKWDEIYSGLRADLVADEKLIDDTVQASEKPIYEKAIAANMTADDILKILEFNASKLGKDYRDFNDRVSRLMAEVGNKPLNAKAPAVQLTPEETLRDQKMLVQTSFFHSMLSSLPAGTLRDRVMSINITPLIQAHAHELDAIYKQYAPEMDTFVAYNQSPTAKALATAEMAAVNEMHTMHAQYEKESQQTVRQQVEKWYAVYKREVAGQ